MIVLGIDPGTHRCGYGVVEKTGPGLKLLSYGIFDTLENDRNALSAERLLRIKQGIFGLCEKFKPDFLSIEKLFINKNLKTAIAIGEARGVAILSAYENGLKIAEYTPLQIKSTITGYGKATKEQVQQMVKNLMKLKELPKPDDAADAVAAALCHLHTNQFLTAGAVNGCTNANAAAGSHYLKYQELVKMHGAGKR